MAKAEIANGIAGSARRKGHMRERLESIKRETEEIHHEIERLVDDVGEREYAELEEAMEILWDAFDRADFDMDGSQYDKQEDRIGKIEERESSKIEARYEKLMGRAAEIVREIRGEIRPLLQRKKKETTPEEVRPLTTKLASLKKVRESLRKAAARHEEFKTERLERIKADSAKIEESARMERALIETREAAAEMRASAARARQTTKAVGKGITRLFKSLRP